MLSKQRQILRNFMKLHDIVMDADMEQDEAEEKIIQYVEKKQFLVINDETR